MSRLMHKKGSGHSGSGCFCLGLKIQQNFGEQGGEKRKGGFKDIIFHQ